jgi:hypothetical protein
VTIGLETVEVVVWTAAYEEGVHAIVLCGRVCGVKRVHAHPAPTAAFPPPAAYTPFNGGVNAGRRPVWVGSLAWCGGWLSERVTRAHALYRAPAASFRRGSGGGSFVGVFVPLHVVLCHEQAVSLFIDVNSPVFNTLLGLRFVGR